jgi:hypothetical protein
MKDILQRGISQLYIGKGIWTFMLRIDTFFSNPYISFTCLIKCLTRQTLNNLELEFEVLK